MAKSSALVKTPGVGDNSEASKNTASKTVMLGVEKFLTGVKATMQSVLLLEKQASEQAVICLQHANDYGDVMPADRLVKGLAEHPHPLTKAMGMELVAWFRANSPIRWDSKAKPRQAKETEEGYKPYNEESAKETPFFETAQAKRSRTAADAARKKALEPATFKDFLNRAKGLTRWFETLNEADKNGDVRGIKNGEAAKIKRGIKAINEALVDTYGDEVITPAKVA